MRNSQPFSFVICGKSFRNYNIYLFLVKENEVPTEKNSSRASFSLQRQVIYQIKAKRLNYLIKDFFFIEFQNALKVFALELRGIVVKYSLPVYYI